MLKEPSDPRDQASPQVFYEPDLEQLAEINVFVEDFWFWALEDFYSVFVVVAFVFLFVKWLSVCRLNASF